jgi:predicted nucleotide-binding protein (sugar kinase/HSP70/actin superfamily)
MGDKPYLILELDEHSAVAGVMTRLEAYKNVIENTMHKPDSDVGEYPADRPHVYPSSSISPEQAGSLTTDRS